MFQECKVDPRLTKQRSDWTQQEEEPLCISQAATSEKIGKNREEASNSQHLP